MSGEDSTTEDPVATPLEEIPTINDPGLPQAPVPPPPISATVDEILRWTANVATMAGSPDAVEVTSAIRRVDVSTPDQLAFARWQMLIGATTQPDRHDALGTTILATTGFPGLWSVTIRAHVSRSST